MPETNEEDLTVDIPNSGKEIDVEIIDDVEEDPSEAVSYTHLTLPTNREV